MLGLAHVLVSEGLHDAAFLERYCHGANHFIAYVLGETDGVAKTPEWARQRSGIRGRRPARARARMAASRTLITVSYSLQRAEHGEQPVWAAHRSGGAARPDRPARRRLRPRLRLDGRPRQRERRRSRCRRCPQGRNPVRAFIPVARIADLLLQPGESFDYDGARHTYPDIRLVYWAGGNPFHHHQDLNRLRRALGAARYRDRARAVLDADGAPCRPRLPRDDVLRAQRHRLGSRRRPHHRDASRRRPGRRGAERPRHPRRAWPSDFGVADAFTEGRDERGLARAPVRRAPRRAPPKPASRRPRFDDVLGRRVARDARSRSRARALRRLPRRSRGQSAAHAERQDRALLRDASPASATTTAPAIRPGSRARNGSARRERRASRWRSSRTTRRRGCTASSTSAPTARRPRCAGANRCGCIRPTPRRAASPTATSCGSSTTAAAASPERSSRPTCAPAWCSSRPAPGSIPTIRSAEIAMCVHGNPNVLTRDVGHLPARRRAAPDSTRSCEVERFDGALPPVRAFAPPPIDI